jgi:hypothetical protein
MAEAINIPFNKNVKMAVAELPEKMLEGAWDEITQVMEVMKGYAQVFVRVDTGSLRDSIRLERGGAGKGWRTIRIRAGGYVTNPRTGRKVDYACIIERKYPYICPAWHRVCHDIEALIRRGVLQRASS